MWKQLIESYTSDFTSFPPTIAEEIANAEQTLKIQFTDELKSLLTESNGFQARYGSGLIWSVQNIVQQNLEYRQYPDFKSLYMPFDHLLFFSDTGCGDLYGYAIRDGVIHQEDIFRWDHETDSRINVALGLRDYIDRFFNDKLEL